MDIIRQWFGRNRLAVLIVLILAANAVLAYQNFLAPAPAPKPVTQSETISTLIPEGMVASSLNGEYILEEVALTRPFAVMIDNLSAARPAAGLSKASVVWETLVEGGVTRLMPIFQTTEDVTIGPVRSARDYYLPWAREVSAVYVHSGGSPAGLAALKANKDIPDGDEFRNGSAFYRVPGLPAPHDLFTSIGRLIKLATDRGWAAETILPAITVSDPVPPKGTKAESITVNFSVSPYRVQWTWDAEVKGYRRVVGGAISEDRNTKAQIVTKNVIVLAAAVSPAPPPAPKEGVVVKSVDFGKAWFFRDGESWEGSWEKTDAVSRVMLKNTDGTPYAIARGQVWIEVVSKDKKDAVVIK